MNIEDLGAWGEFISGIAVLAGLIFVGIQIKISNRESRLNAGRAFSDAISKLAITMSENGELADIYIRGLHNIEDLGEVDRLRFVSFVSNGIFRALEGLYTNYLEGTLDPSLWDNQSTSLKQILKYKGMRQVWDIRKASFAEGFRDFIDELIINEIQAGTEATDWYGEYGATKSAQDT